MQRRTGVLKSDGRRRLQGPPAIKGHLVRHELRSREGASESAERREKAGGRAGGQEGRRMQGRHHLRRGGAAEDDLVEHHRIRVDVGRLAVCLAPRNLLRRAPIQSRMVAWTWATTWRRAVR